MTERPRAVVVDFVKFVGVPSRAVMQMVVEVPINQAAECLMEIGNPVPGAHCRCFLMRADPKTPLGIQGRMVDVTPQPQQSKHGPWKTRALALVNKSDYREWARCDHAQAVQRLYDLCAIHDLDDLETDKNAQAELAEEEARFERGFYGLA